MCYWKQFPSFFVFSIFFFEVRNLEKVLTSMKHFCNVVNYPSKKPPAWSNSTAGARRNNVATLEPPKSPIFAENTLPIL